MGDDIQPANLVDAHTVSTVCGIDIIGHLEQSLSLVCLRELSQAFTDYRCSELLLVLDSAAELKRTGPVGRASMAPSLSGEANTSTTLADL